MENINSELTYAKDMQVIPSEKNYIPQNREFNLFMDTLASIVEKHGIQVLEELRGAV